MILNWKKKAPKNVDKLFWFMWHIWKNEFLLHCRSSPSTFVVSDIIGRDFWMVYWWKNKHIAASIRSRSTFVVYFFQGGDICEIWIEIFVHCFCFVSLWFMGHRYWKNKPIIHRISSLSTIVFPVFQGGDLCEISIGKQIGTPSFRCSTS